MSRLLASLMVLGMLSASWAASAKKAPAKKSVTAAATQKTPAKKTASKASSKNSTARRTASAGARTSTRTAAWRTRQAQPTPERYKQIQEALAAKGYMRPEDATGAWGPDSMDALKRFQADQKIDGAGKINSLSLIALGLGPKHDAVASVKPPLPPPAQ